MKVTLFLLLFIHKQPTPNGMGCLNYYSTVTGAVNGTRLIKSFHVNILI